MRAHVGRARVGRSRLGGLKERWIRTSPAYFEVQFTFQNPFILQTEVDPFADLDVTKFYAPFTVTTEVS